MPQLPKLQPGAAPEPKPAPNAVEQDVSNDGMRHYLRQDHQALRRWR